MMIMMSTMKSQALVTQFINTTTSGAVFGRQLVYDVRCRFVFSHLQYDLSQFIKKGFEEMSHFIQISKNSSTFDGSFVKVCPDRHC